MNKIASPQQLQDQLRCLLACCDGPDHPSRVRMAADLRQLANTVAGVRVGGDYEYDFKISDEAFIGAIKDFARKAGATAVTGPGMHTGMHVYFSHLMEAGARPMRVGFNLMFLYKHYPPSHMTENVAKVSFGIYTAFNNKGNNRLLTKEVYGDDSDGDKLFRQFVKRLSWTATAIGTLTDKGILAPNTYGQ